MEELRLLLPKTNQPKKKRKKQQKKTYEEMPKGLERGQVGAGPRLGWGRSVLGLFASLAAVFASALGCP